MTAPAQPIEQPRRRVTAWRPAFIRSLPLRLSVFVICLLWTIPTLGLLVTSVRDPLLITTSGWWTALLHPFDAEPMDAVELPDGHQQRRAWATRSSTA